MKTLSVLYLPALFLVISYNSTLAQKTLKGPALVDSILCDEITSCTNDPTYKFFEKEQLKAYCATLDGRYMLNVLHDTAFNDSIFISVDSMLINRLNSLGSKNDSKLDRQVKNILESASRKKLPTCYENPQLYFMINAYMKDIERARKQLKLPLKLLPKYGSLPTSEINAYTYPPSTDKDAIEKTGSIIGFNTQLFKFAYQMPKITFPTINISSDVASNKINIDFSRETAVKNIKANPDLKVNFVMAVLEFLQLVGSSTKPLDSKFDSDLIEFTTAIEMFAVAHEYGHLIKGHVFEGTKKLSLNSTEEGKTYETIVGLRSWKQELEADEIGLKLLIQVLKNKISDSKDGLSRESVKLRHIYKLYGPLFYFKCSEIIEDAKYIRDKNIVPNSPSAEEKAYLRDMVNAKITTDQKIKFANYNFSSHPPAWLRSERIFKLIQEYEEKETFSELTLSYALIGKGLVENVDILWGLSLPRIPLILDVLKTKSFPDKKLYTISPKYWDLTFLSNPELQNAIEIFSNPLSEDSIIINNYHAAIKTDWLLLSGVQIRWAENSLMLNDTTERKEALSVIALGGDKQSLLLLRKINTSKWSEQDQQVSKKAIQFLERNGRITSIDAFKNLQPERMRLTDLLSFPIQPSNNFSIDNLIPTEVSNDIKEFLRRNRAVLQKGSLSSMALYMIIANTSDHTSYGFWIDLLLRSKNLDIAMNYAQYALIKLGPDASIENDIGNILSSKGELRNAIQHYENSIQLGRKDGWPEMNIAKNYVKLKEFTTAEQWFKKAIGRSSTVRNISEYAEYLNEYAWFLVINFKDDATRIKEALKLSSISNKLVKFSDPSFLDTLAECFAANGEYELSIKAAESALNLISKDSSERGEYEKRLNEFKNKSIIKN